MNPKIIVTLCLFIISCKTESKQDKIHANSEPNKASSAFNLEVYDFEGLETYLYRSDEKTYVINFWATWCAPCIKELPHFEALHANYKENGVEVILVSLDFPRLYETKLIPYIEKHDLRSKIVALDDPDANAWISKVDENWSGAIPATLIHNKNKRKFYEQSFDYEQLKNELDQFLN